MGDSPWKALVRLAGNPKLLEIMLLGQVSRQTLKTDKYIPLAFLEKSFQSSQYSRQILPRSKFIHLHCQKMTVCIINIHSVFSLPLFLKPVRVWTHHSRKPLTTRSGHITFGVHMNSNFIGEEKLDLKLHPTLSLSNHPRWC